MRTAARPPRRLLDESGLTLIELLVVMVILGLFYAIVNQAFFPQVDKAKVQTTQTQMEIIALALDSYRLDLGEYPPSLNDLLTSTGERWHGPYLQKGRIPTDPWGNEYVYSPGSDGTEFELYSSGDGKQEIRYGAAPQ
jgi:general secretion pathway protein G